MTYLHAKTWSDAARAAALAKRRGQAAPPQQSQTAEDAVAHANALIASGILNKGKKPKAGGKGKGAGKAPKAKDPAIAKEHAQRLAEHAQDRAQRQADHAAAQAEHAQRQKEHEADRAQRQQDRAQRQAEHQQALADKAKAVKEKAKAKAGGGSGKPKQSDAKQQEKADKAKADAELGDAANALATGNQLTEPQAQRLVTEGLAQTRPAGGIQLTPKGKSAARRRTAAITKGTSMPETKANRRNSTADAAYHQTVHDGAVERGAVCAGMKAAARYSGADLAHVQGMHDSSVALGAECQPVMKAAPPQTDDPTLDTSAPVDTTDEMSEDEGTPTVSITLPVPPDVAAELAIDGGMDAATLALELLDLGDMDALASQKFAILAAVEQVIQDYSTIDAEVSAVGRAITPDADGMTPFYVSVASPDLDTLRSALLEALQQFNVDADADAFVPRIELQDIGPDDPTPTDMPTVASITFDTLCVNFAGAPVLFPLGDPAADEAALEDAQDGGADDAQEDASGALVTKSIGDDTLVNFGGAVKSLDNGHVGGYLVRFSGPHDPDLTGDFFTKDTDFGFAPDETLKTAVYFNHRLPLKTRDGRELTIKQKIGSGVLSMDDTGVFIDAVLYNRERYESTLARQGWSSGTASHLVDREPVGKSMWVKSWQLGLDASITPTPAEPRTSVLSLKSFLADTQRPEARAQAGRTPATHDAVAHADAAPDILIIVKR